MKWTAILTHKYTTLEPKFQTKTNEWMLNGCLTSRIKQMPRHLLNAMEALKPIIIHSWITGARQLCSVSIFSPSRLSTHIRCVRFDSQMVDFACQRAQVVLCSYSITYGDIIIPFNPIFANSVPPNRTIAVSILRGRPYLLCTDYNTTISTRSLMSSRTMKWRHNRVAVRLQNTIRI